MTEVNFRKLNILIVDDEKFSRGIILRLVKEIGARKISTAQNGFDALTILEESKFGVDVILLDLKMPRMNGFEFLKRLHEELGPPLSNTPVIVISGYSEKKSLDRAMKLGVRLFLLKPITADQLKTRINEAIRQRDK